MRVRGKGGDRFDFLKLERVPAGGHLFLLNIRPRHSKERQKVFLESLQRKKGESYKHKAIFLDGNTLTVACEKEEGVRGRGSKEREPMSG